LRRRDNGGKTHSGGARTDEIDADFSLLAVAEAGWPVYQGSNNSIFQQRNFV